MFYLSVLVSVFTTTLIERPKDVDKALLVYLPRHKAYLVISAVVKVAMNQEEFDMTATSVRVPKFRHMQWVNFDGGEGIIQSRKSESGSWTYLIKMTLGPEPSFGRIGVETTVLLSEVELRAA